jgi:hypothetical protein
MDVLESVSKGMRVVDAEGRDIGRIGRVVPANPKAEVFEDAVVPSQQSPFNLGLNAILGTEPKVPEEMARRLFHSGYIKIEGHGPLAGTSYAAADAIDRVEGTVVYLNLTRHGLAAQV